MRLKNILFLFLICFFISGCNEKKAQNEIVLLKGQFSEISIIMEMAKLLIEKDTNLKVKFHDPMNTVAAAKILQDGGVDLYVGYDGTLLSTILRNDPKNVPKDMSLFDFVNDLAKKEKGLMLIGKLGFENTYAIGIKEEFAKKHDIKNISDLQKFSKDLVFGAEHEFFDESGSVRFEPLNKAYELTWKDSKSLDINLKYLSIDQGNIDVMIVYSTDGLNKKSNLRILKDDKAFFPTYNASLFTRVKIFDEYNSEAKNLKDVLEKLNNLIDNETMIELNFEADANKKEPSKIAYEFLKNKGLL